MMKIIRQYINVPFGIPAPKYLLEIGAFLLRTETELIIKSRKVISERLNEAGFNFKFTDFSQAIKNLENEKSVKSY